MDIKYTCLYIDYCLSTLFCKKNCYMYELCFKSTVLLFIPELFC